MQNTLRISTKVLPGGRIDVSSPQLTEGEAVDVLVVPKSPARRTQSMLEFLKSLPSDLRLFRGASEIDDYLQAERSAWER